MNYFKNKNHGLLTKKDLRHPRYFLLYIVLSILSIGMVLVSILPPLWILLSSFKDIKELFQVPPTFIPEKKNTNGGDAKRIGCCSSI